METRPVVFLLDPKRFHQAPGNLLSNAAKLSPDGGTVTIRIAHHETDNSTLVVTVSDKGPGIPVAFRDKLSERFSQADVSTTRAEGSSGLARKITKTLIEAFDGTIKYDTVVGQGSDCHCHLLICQAALEIGHAGAPGTDSLS